MLAEGKKLAQTHKIKKKTNNIWSDITNPHIAVKAGVQF